MCVLLLPLFGSKTPYFLRGALLLFSGFGSSFLADGLGDGGGVLSRDGEGEMIGLDVSSS